ncbi:MAG TPA: outer membrane beta-barrel protein [Longimicrobiales bacterium]|nr:outer membrane beta-barrel protein [Longimicrobiales bacterium]
MIRVSVAVLCVMTALLTMQAAPAAAQRIDSPYRFIDASQHAGLFAGYVDASPGRVGLGPQPGPVVGGRWGIRISGPFTVGAEVAYIPTTRAVRDTVFDADEGAFRELGEADMRLLTAMANLTFSLTGPRTWNGLRPLLSAGAGAAFDLAGRSSLDDELPGGQRYRFGTSFAGQFGAGVEWFALDRVSVRADARNALWRISNPEAFRLTEEGRTIPRSQWESNLTLTAGLSIHF